MERAREKGMDAGETGVEDLARTLALEPIEVDLFRGRTAGRQGPRIYGGHVIAQSLLAAYETVEQRLCHSLHCYFIHPGDPKAPILYEVDRARDGPSFTTRRVTAIQHGRQIFNMAASFQVAESGFEHQEPMPAAQPPEGLRDPFKRFDDMLPEAERAEAARTRPIEQRTAEPIRLGEAMASDHTVWIRAKAPIGPDQRLQQAVLAYASDLAFLETSLRPHGVAWETPGMQTASLDHAIWFHRPFDFNVWLLYAQDSPSAHAGRGLVRGQVFTADGVLVASVMQEALIRLRKR
jgi:acyl-CoA thioesterase-2